MYAIVDIAGQQFKVEKGQEVFVHRLQEEEGAKVSFDDVLLIENNGKVVVGAPVIDGAAVNATVVEHLKGDKVLVFRKKRRKGFKRMNGHRQYMSLIKIDGIIETGAKKKEAPAKAKVVAEKKSEAQPEAKKEVKAAAEKEAPKAKAEAKKETPKTEAKEVKKPAAKKPAAKTAKPAAKKTTAAKAEKKEVKKAAPKAAKKTDKDSEETKSE